MHMYDIFMIDVSLQFAFDNSHYLKFELRIHLQHFKHYITNFN